MVVPLRMSTRYGHPILMVADAYDVVSALAGVRSAHILLEDHFAEDAINSRVAARAGFARTFPGETQGELDSLRADFLRKAVMAGTDQVFGPLAEAAVGPDAIASMTLGDLQPSVALSRLRQRRAELGLTADDQDPLVIDPVTSGTVGVGELTLHLRKARTTGIRVQANAGICRGMLRHRYDAAGQGESASGGSDQGEEKQ
jgi:hypothetical protein